MSAIAASAPIRLGSELNDRFATLPDWLKPDQVAKLLGNCSTEHVRVLREKGAIEARDFRAPGSKVATYRFYKDSVRLYLATRPTPGDLLGI